jgi:enolase-phosphatase E1
MIRYILCDVEGTTTDIAFVHRVLFPFASTHLSSFLRDNPLELATASRNIGIAEADVEAFVQNCIAKDIKHAELKRIQGIMWKEGYASGVLQGHVYADVEPAFRRWNEAGIGVGIYSSGSVQAQKLLYANSVCGDLTVWLHHHFDLAVGYKYEASSYQKIVDVLNIPAGEILFLSDIEAELDAARSVGMQTMRLQRDAVIQSTHPIVLDFSSICPT